MAEAKIKVKEKERLKATAEALKRLRAPGKPPPREQEKAAESP